MEGAIIIAQHRKGLKDAQVYWNSYVNWGSSVLEVD
jgi:hypothetical protein